MDNSYPFHTNPGLFLQSQNRASGLSTGSPHFLHRLLLVESISIPISGLLITKIEFITQILTQQPTTVSGHSRTAQKSQKKFHNSVPCFGTDPTAHSRSFSYQYMYFNTKFPQKQPKNSGQSRMVGKIPNNF